MIRKRDKALVEEALVFTGLKKNITNIEKNKTSAECIPQMFYF